MTSRRKTDIFGIIFTLVITIITLVISLIVPDIAIMGVMVLIAILFGIIAYWIADYIVNQRETKEKQIDENTENILKNKRDIEELYKKLDTQKEISELRAEVRLMKKKMRGTVDPRIVIAMVIVILFLIYLYILFF